MHQAAKLALGACCKVTAMSPAWTGAAERGESKVKFSAMLKCIQQPPPVSDAALCKMPLKSDHSCLTHIHATTPKSPP